MADKVRIEIHLTKQAAKRIDEIAKADNRSRKNLIEYLVAQAITNNKTIKGR